MAEQQQEFVDFEFDADFAGTKEFGGGDYPLLPIGDYIFEVVNVSQKASSNNNQMVVVESVVAEGQDNDEAAKFTGQRTWTNYVLLPQSLGRLKQLMIACGAPMDKFRASALLGARYRGTITHAEGSTEPGPDGTPRKPRTFANVCQEKPLEGTTQKEAPPPPPPVTKAAAPANGKGPATRRA